MPEPRIPASLDHLVLATPDLAATVAWAERELGVRPSAGGRHVGRGTRNFLLGLGGGSYLEIIGRDPEQPEPPSPRPFGIDRLAAPALVAWAIRSSDLDGAVRIAAREGVDLGTVEAMSRATPDGEVLRWRLTLRPYTGVAVMPFFIDWASTRHPSTTAAQGGSLDAFRATHPHPESIWAALAALGVSLEVARGDGEALRASISGPAGRVTLT